MCLTTFSKRKYTYTKQNSSLVLPLQIYLEWNCFLTGRNDRSILTNYITKEETEGSLFKCTICGHVNALKTNVLNHVESIHFPDTFVYNCQVCGKTTKSKQSLYKHMSVNHRGKWYTFVSFVVHGGLYSLIIKQILQEMIETSSWNTYQKLWIRTAQKTCGSVTSVAKLVLGRTMCTITWRTSTSLAHLSISVKSAPRKCRPRRLWTITFRETTKRESQE